MKKRNGIFLIMLCFFLMIVLSSCTQKSNNNKEKYIENSVASSDKPSNAKTASGKFDYFCVNGEGSYTSLEEFGTDYANAQGLVISGVSGNALSDFEVFSGIETLMIMDSQIADFGPISKFTKLKKLEIDGTNISDSAFPNKQYTFKKLEISSTSINQISSNSGNRISGKPISVNLKGLTFLTNLEELTAPCFNISDLTPLKNMTKFRYLSLPGNRISDLSSLANLRNLEELIILDGSFGIKSIKPLENLVHLKHVMISQAALDNIPASEFKKYGGKEHWGSKDGVIEVD